MKSIRNEESGLVSIIVTVVLMIVISITVLSFAQIIRREQRQALDKQLSSQAFYAAESGVNDVVRLLKGKAVPEKTTCANSGVYTDLQSGVVDTSTGVNIAYTCVLVSGQLSDLIYDLYANQSSRIMPLNGSSAIKQVTFNWTPAAAGTTPTTNCNGPTQLPPAAEWACGYSVLRVDLVPIGASLTRDQLRDNTVTSFLIPAAAASGAVPRIGALCTNGDGATCTATVDVPSSSKYYARVSTLYRDTTMTITAKDAGGNPVTLSGAQLMVDSTGRAEDVLRRIQVRVNVSPEGTHADYALQSLSSICKKYTVAPSSPYVDCPVPDPTEP